MPFLPFIPFLDCAEVVYRFTQQSKLFFLTLGFQFNTAVTLTDLQTLETAADTWWTNFLAGQISTNCALNDIKVTGLTTATDPAFATPPATQAAGTLTGTVLDAASAMVVTFNTAKRGRSYRGRNYVAGRITADLQTISTWTSGRVAAVQNAYINIPSTFGPVNWSHVILSRQENSVRRTVGVATPVVSYTTKTQIGSQRGRLI